MKCAKKRGVFLVIEGGDGSGKATQVAELISKLEKFGKSPRTVDFPRYTKPSSYFVKEYLNGNYGSIKEVGPYCSSMFYALDRYDAAPEIRKWLESGDMVVANRYVSSNMAHQGAKLRTTAQRKIFFKWLYGLEYDLFNIPRPTLVIILHVPAAVAQKLVDKKGSREYIGGVKRDLHESNIKHLRQAEAAYLEMAKLFPRQFKVIQCTEGKRLLSVPEIHEKVWKIVGKYV
ncbi:MAG: thymidylate kinase [Candidatus Liptonbacteria bacterium]